MNRQNSLAVLLCAVALAACNYEKNAVQDITAPNAGAAIKFFNFGVNAPAVNFYANDTKVTAVSSTTGTESTAGTGYGGVGLAGLYSGLAPGQYTFSGRISATIDKDRPISTVATTIADGKYYSFYMSGFYDATAKTVEGFVVEDPFVAPTDFTLATVRFVHAISNANPLTLSGKSGTAAEIAIGGEVGYKFAGAFTTIPAGAYDLTARYGGAGTTALTRPAVTFVGGRVYTITARGDITVLPSTACAAANRTCLDNTTNR